MHTTWLLEHPFCSLLHKHNRFEWLCNSVLYAAWPYYDRSWLETQTICCESKPRYIARLSGLCIGGAPVRNELRCTRILPKSKPWTVVCSKGMISNPKPEPALPDSRLQVWSRLVRLSDCIGCQYWNNQPTPPKDGGEIPRVSSALQPPPA